MKVVLNTELTSEMTISELFSLLWHDFKYSLFKMKEKSSKLNYQLIQYCYNDIIILVMFSKDEKIFNRLFLLLCNAHFLFPA